MFGKTVTISFALHPLWQFHIKPFHAHTTDYFLFQSKCSSVKMYEVWRNTADRKPIYDYTTYQMRRAALP